MFKYIFIPFLFLIFSCGPSKDSPWYDQYQKVMAIHDEVMPEMGTMAKLKKGLKKVREENNSLSEEQSTQVNELITRLTQAEDGMWDWMHEFDKPANNADVEETMTYLKSEEEKIAKVSKDMKSSIQDASNLLEKLTN